MAPISSSAADLDRRPSVSSSIRSGLRQSRVPAPGSPHTPQHSRHILSPYTGSTSPGSSFRHEEDAVILEIGSRWLRVGFEGNSTPTCVIGFGPEEGRRVGDYRGWMRNNNDEVARKMIWDDTHQWSKDHELWSSDIRELDIGLVEDKIERAIREAYNKYLLTDAGSSRLVLVLPSLVPHPLLSSVLSTIFYRWRYPSVTLLPVATMATVSAGLRSSLVVDIGWEETTVTGIYEYREIQSKRSTRSMKCLMRYMGKFLTQLIHQKNGTKPKPEDEDDTVSVSFQLCEEILTRQAWCKIGTSGEEQEIAEDGRDSSIDPDGDGTKSQSPDAMVSLPLPLQSGPAYVDVPFSKFSEPVEKTLFGSGSEGRDWDDEDMPLDILIYNSLLALPPDIRGSCMSRIVFIGGGANIPGIRQRILNDVNSLIQKLQWSLTRGKAVNKSKKQPQDVSTDQYISRSDNSTSEDGSRLPPEQESNFIDERLERNNKDSKPYVHGVVRQVDSLGPWAGASLLTSLKVKGLVEIEREKFLQHGLAGASRDADISAVLERRAGHGSGTARSGGERSSWTLGEWG